MVELYDDGQLKRVARVVGGACVRELTLEHGSRRGRHTDYQGSGGSADWTTHQDGYSEDFDAWSDNSRPRPEAFARFVERAIAHVIG